MNLPRVSVIVPLYNQGRYLSECVRSLQQQTMPDWEAIIVDDGSTDDSWAIAKQLSAAEPRLRIFSKPNGGLASARNYGLDRATGQFIQLLDADDALLPQKFEKQLLHLQHASQGSVSVTHYRFGSHDCLSREPYPPMPFGLTSATTLAEFIDGWEFEISVPCHCFLIPAFYFNPDGLRFCPELENHEDFECWLRLLAQNPPLLILEECYAIYRAHPLGMTRNQQKMRRGFLAAVNLSLARANLPAEACDRLRAKMPEINRVYDRRLGLTRPLFPLEGFPRARIALGALRNKVRRFLFGRPRR